MARQPIRPGAAPAGRAAAAATPSVTGHQQLERSGAAQAARLRLLTGSGQRGTEGCPLVVFVGVGDDRRSRLAAALLAHRANGRAQAISMSQTTVEPDPMAVEVMGYDSQTLDELPRAEDWFIDDPAGKDRETLRYLRDAIDRQVQRLLVRIGGAAPATQALRDNG